MSLFVDRVRFALTDPLGAAKHVMRKRRFPFSDRGALQIRSYASYEEYRAQQREKLDASPTAWLQEFNEKSRAVLRDRLEDANVVRRGDTVLCLAARLGTEVQAVLDFGW